MSIKGLNILYEDEFVIVTEICISLRKYYFPLATSKTLLFTDMTKI